MIIDGKMIAKEVKERVARALEEFKEPLVLGIVVVGNDPVIESFVRIKKKFANDIGVSVREFRFPNKLKEKELTTEELQREISGMIGHGGLIDGLIVQLPLPENIEISPVLNTIPIDKDVDMLSHEAMGEFRKGTSPILPPVAGAIQEILERNKVSVAGKDVLIIGRGRLVGAPAELFFRHNHAHVTMIGRGISRLEELTKEADIIVCGAGQPGLLQPEMLKPGVVVIDAGTSEAGGKIVGDADPRCAEVASVFTPVPGGVGPIAVAMIFKNLCVLARKRKHV